MSFKKIKSESGKRHAYYKTKIQKQKENMIKLEKENLALKMQNKKYSDDNAELQYQIIELESQLDFLDKNKRIQEQYEFLTSSLYENKLILCECFLEVIILTFELLSSSLNRNFYTLSKRMLPRTGSQKCIWLLWINFDFQQEAGLSSKFEILSNQRYITF